MSTRKTLALADIIAEMDKFVERTPDGMDRERQAVHNFVANLLLKADAYAGYRYLQPYGEPGTDPTRTSFYLHRKLG